MTEYEKAVEGGARSLLALFGESAPENAAADAAQVYAISLIIGKRYVESLAEEIWERYDELVKHREG